MAERVEERKAFLTKKKLGIFALLILLLLSSVAYVTMQWVEAKEIREHLDLGNKYYAEAQYEEAIIEYEKVLELDEKNVEARIGLVKSYRALNKVVEARKVLVAGIQIVPKEPRFYSDLVDIYLADGNVLEAVKVLDEGLSAIKDDSLIKKRTEISNDLELTVDRTLLQVDETANLQVVYHSRVISDAEDKQEAGSEQSVPNDSDNGEAVKEELSNEQGSSDSGNSDSEHSGGKTTNVSAAWSLSTKGPGSLAKDKGEANVFSAKQPGTVRVTAKVGSISKDATIEVKDHVLREIKVQTSASAVKPSEVVQLVAKGFDAKGEEIEINPAWSIKSGAGTLSEATGPANTFTTEEEGTTEIVVSQDKIEASVTIAVEKRQFVLTKISNGQGTIQSNPNDKEFTDGDVITLTATPAQGWEFSHWEGDASGTDSKVTVKMDQNKTVEAVFTKIPEYTISSSVEGNGSIAKSPSDGKYLKGATVTLEAIPNEGWKFERWEGDVNATNQKVTLTMDENKAVRAIFSRVPESYQLTTEAIGEGSIDRTPNTDVYAEGTEVRLTATPKEGWKFDHWTGDATGTQSTVAVTMDEEKTVKAVFVKVSQPSVETYTLQTSVEGEGTVQAQPAQDKYEAGTAVQLTATPKEGWKFDHWTGDVMDTQSTVTVTMDGEKTVKAIFVKVSQPPVETYTLQTSVEGEGTVQPQPAQDSYEAGTTVQLTATSKEGWSFKEWSGDASGETNPLSVHMDSNKQIKAVFVEHGTIKGIVKNARTGTPAPSIAIKVRKGEGVETGNVIAETTTNSAGQYELRLEPGTYTLALSGNGYNEKYESVAVQGATTNEQDINIMPENAELTEFSVVLSWGERPSDLDAHLKGPSANGTGRFHIYYGQQSYTENGVTYAQLDTDDTDGKGPETVTVFKEVTGTYRYYIHNYSGNPALTGSGAKVELYKNGNLYRTFTVPAEGVGLYWHVFEIENGQLRVINKLASNEME